MASEEHALIREILTKHGPWAVFATVACVALYIFALKPMADERVLMMNLLSNDVQQKQSAMVQIADSTRQIAEAVTLQKQAMERIEERTKKSRAVDMITLDKLDKILDRMPRP